MPGFDSLAATEVIRPQMKEKVMTDYKDAPTVLKRGMPPEQRNGLYGNGAPGRLINMGVGERFTAVVTYEVADIRSSEAEETQYPLVEAIHIEPVWDTERVAVVRQAQLDEYNQRTGQNQLNFDAIGEPAPQKPSDAQAEEDAAFDAAAPKKSAAKKAAS